MRAPQGPITAASGIAAIVMLAAMAAPSGSAAAAVAARPGAAARRLSLSPRSQRPPQGVAAYAAELAIETTGRQLWGRRQYTPRPIASIAKVMTALVVIRSGDLDKRIRVTRADEAYLGCCIQGAGLRVGDVLTTRQLLYAMLLPSGADAAAALAGSYGPGWPAFIGKMNATAKRLDLLGTHFTGFDGVLPSTVSTPRNLLLLGEAAMRSRVFREVVRHRSYRITAGPHHHAYYWPNTNLLLTRYPGAVGIKTGWTGAAGDCLLFEATRGKRTLIGVVLDSAAAKTDRTFVDAARMLNWGFRVRLTAGRAPERGAMPHD